MPTNVRARLESDWKDIIDNFYTLPTVFWPRHQELIGRYTVVSKMKATPTSVPNATAIPTGAFVEVAVPTLRNVTLYGCDVNGTACQIVDVWTNSMVYKYDLRTEKPLGSRSTTSAVAYTVILKWKDNRWKLDKISGQLVKYVTQTPSPTAG